MSIKFLLWLGVFVFCLSPTSAAAMPHETESQFLEKTNAELDYVDDLLERELNFAERARDDERSKDIQGLQLWVRELRGDLLKLAPASREVWRDLRPQLRYQLGRLRLEVAELKKQNSNKMLAE